MICMSDTRYALVRLVHPITQLQGDLNATMRRHPKGKQTSHTMSI